MGIEALLHLATEPGLRLPFPKASQVAAERKKQDKP